MTRPDVTVLCNMAGTASALMPVIRGLRKRHNVHVVLEKVGKAIEQFEKSDIPFTLIGSTEGIPLEGRVLLTGATPIQMKDGRPFNYSREPEAWLMARGLGVPSVALLDKYTPSETRGRFTDVRSAELVFPAEILMPNANSSYAIVEFFSDIPEFSKVDLHTTGNPNFDNIPKRLKEVERTHRRDKYLVRVPVFMSSQLYMRQNGTNNLELLEGVVKGTKGRAMPIVKVHPKDTPEDIEIYEEYLGTNGEVDAVSNSEDLALSLASYELCVGASSTLLEYATLADKLAVVVQPGLDHRKDEYVTNVAGVTPAAYNANQAEAVISVLLEDAELRKQWADIRKSFTADGKATERVIESIEQFL